MADPIRGSRSRDRSDVKPAFGARLVRLRLRHFSRQADLAERVGVAPGTVAVWEAGRRLPSTVALLQLADVLQVSVDELLRGDRGEDEDEDPNQMAIPA